MATKTKTTTKPVKPVKTKKTEPEKKTRRPIPWKYRLVLAGAATAAIGTHEVTGLGLKACVKVYAVLALITIVAVAAQRPIRYARARGRRGEHGIASWWEQHRHLSVHSVRRAAKWTHPHLTTTRRKAATEIGVVVGRRWFRKIVGTVEEFYLIISPPRTVKTLWLASVLYSWDGPAIVASSRLDIIRHTIAARLRLGGRVWLLNPDKLGKVASTLQWDVLEGCADPSTAMTRAGQLAEAGPQTGDMRAAGFWDTQGFELLRTMCHAAKLAGKNAATARHWCTNPRDPEPLRILSEPGAPAPDWAQWLQAFLKMGDETIGVAAAQAASCLAWLADPQMATAACPAPGKAVSLNDFMHSKDTIFLIGTDKPRTPFAPFFACFISAAIAALKEEAAMLPNERLIRKLLVELDEAPIICPVRADRISAELGGWGGTLIISTQSHAQLGKTWDEDGGQIVWDNATKIIGPGFDNPKAARQIAEMCGTHGRGGDPDDPDSRAEWVIPPNRIRSLSRRKFEGLIMARSVRPVIARLALVHKLPGYEPWPVAECRELFGAVIDPTVPDEPDLPLTFVPDSEMAAA